jgi:hypothetical protein
MRIDDRRERSISRGRKDEVVLGRGRWTLLVILTHAATLISSRL